MKLKMLIVGTGLAVSGLAIACNVRAMPPFMVDVSLWDIAVEWAQGESNPASSAFLEELDSMGESAFGEAWVADNFVGYVYPKTSVGGVNGVTQVFVDEPCDQNAKEGASNAQSGGGGGGSGPPPTGGGSPGLPGYAAGDCGTVDVGDVEQV